MEMSDVLAYIILGLAVVFIVMPAVMASMSLDHSVRYKDAVIVGLYAIFLMIVLVVFCTALMLAVFKVFVV